MPRFLPPFLFAMAALLGTAAALPAQSPCQLNRIDNGNFQSIFPLWTKTGPVQSTFDTSTNVNGIAPTRSWQLWGATGPFTLHAPAPLMLAAGDYELSIDLMKGAGYSTSINFGLTQGATRLSIGSWAGGGAGRVRIAILFSVTAPGNHTLDLAVSTDSRETLWFDDATLHQAVLPFFNFDQNQRRAGVGNALHVRAEADDFVAVCVALAPQVPDLTLPTCSGTLQIGPLGTLITAVPLTSCDVQGNLRGGLTIPAALAGVPLWWQAVRFDPGCHVGCGDLIAF